MKFQQGFFKPRFPKKYAGNVNQIVYRSSWELRLMNEFDMNPDVISWNSEELIISYTDAATGKLRRYFPDFIIKKRNKSDGRIKTIVVEVKPFHESPIHSRPVKGKKTEKRYLAECKTWANNYSKWESAMRYCKRMGWEFIVMTEKELGLPYKKPSTK